MALRVMNDNEDLHGFGQRQKNVYEAEKMCIIAEKYIIKVTEQLWFFHSGLLSTYTTTGFESTYVSQNNSVNNVPAYGVLIERITRCTWCTPMEGSRGTTPTTFPTGASFGDIP
jgi:hypothetical protein